MYDSKILPQPVEIWYARTVMEKMVKKSRLGGGWWRAVKLLILDISSLKSEILIRYPWAGGAAQWSMVEHLPFAVKALCSISGVLKEKLALNSRLLCFSLLSKSICLCVTSK